MEETVKVVAGGEGKGGDGRGGDGKGREERGRERRGGEGRRRDRPPFQKFLDPTLLRLPLMACLGPKLGFIRFGLP